MILIEFDAAGLAPLSQEMARMERAFDMSAQAMTRIGESQRKRNLVRVTEQGIDVHGAPFAPYSTKGPIYIYLQPGTRGPRISRSATASPIPKGESLVYSDAGGPAIDIVSDPMESFGRKVRQVTDRQRRRSAAQSLARRTQGPEYKTSEEGQVTKGGGLKFSSYAAFKLWLGRNGIVDLMGLHARMTQQVVTSNPQQNSIAIGVYGEASDRAHGHQDGVPSRNLPKREWLGATVQEQEEGSRDIQIEVDRNIAEAKQ